MERVPDMTRFKLRHYRNGSTVVARLAELRAARKMRVEPLKIVQISMRVPVVDRSLLAHWAYGASNGEKSAK